MTPTETVALPQPSVPLVVAVAVGTVVLPVITIVSDWVQVIPPCCWVDTRMMVPGCEIVTLLAFAARIIPLSVFHSLTVLAAEAADSRVMLVVTQDREPPPRIWAIGSSTVN